jgi:hypothetical protein
MHQESTCAVLRYLPSIENSAAHSNAVEGSSSGKSKPPDREDWGSKTMQCDLCKRKNGNKRLLCQCCTEMIVRLITVDERMRTREVCEAERLAQSAANASGAAA